MPSSSASAYGDYLEAKLITAIGTGTTTGVTIKVKKVNGAVPTWKTVAHRLKIVQKTSTENKVEKVQVASGTTQSGQTVTLGTLTRALPLLDGTDFSGSGTAQTFAAGADVFLTWDAHDSAQTPKLDIANTFTAGQTFSAPITVSGTTSYVKLPELTTTQRDALTASEGMLIKNSTTGTIQQYVGGAWASVGTDATANGSTTVAGKFEEATVAEQGSATATGGTGARLVPAVANLVKTSSGASDENKIPVLNASGQLASGFVDTSSIVTGIFGDGTDGDVTLSGTTTLTRDMNYNSLNLNGNTLNMACYKVFVKGTLSGSGTMSAPTGGNGGNASGTTGGTAGTAVSAGSLPAAPAGKAGGNGGSGGSPNGTAGAAGGSGDAVANSISTTASVAGRAGGSGGTTGAGSGGSGGAAGSAGTTTFTGKNNLVNLTLFASNVGATFTALGGIGGSGAGGGGGEGGDDIGTGGSGGGGGGSGASAGYWFIAAKTITGSFNISALGGNGGNGANGNNNSGGAAGGGGGGGGGSGGAGGSGILIYGNKTAWSGTFVTTGGTAGTGGTGGSGSPSGSSASNGFAGPSGTVIQLQSS